MQKTDKLFEKYFWDGSENISNTFFVKRVLEYGSFPDILKIPLPLFVKEIKNIDIYKLRTSKKRILFLNLLMPHLDSAASWQDLIYKMANIY
ncbi:MAG: hypothetical protein ACOX2F_11890 [bacterium]